MPRMESPRNSSRSLLERVPRLSLARELKRAANEYCEDALRRTEEAVAEAYDEIKQSRARFRAAAGASSAPSAGSTGSRPIYDAEADQD